MRCGRQQRTRVGEGRQGPCWLGRLGCCSVTASCPCCYPYGACNGLCTRPRCTTTSRTCGRACCVILGRSDWRPRATHSRWIRTSNSPSCRQHLPISCAGHLLPLQSCGIARAEAGGRNEGQFKDSAASALDHRLIPLWFLCTPSPLCVRLTTSLAFLPRSYPHPLSKL